MRVAILTEGDSEWGALPTLWPQLHERSGNDFLSIMRLQVQPDGPPEKIARSAKTILKICATKAVDLVVVVLDRETQDAACGHIASAIEAEFAANYSLDMEVKVVLKDRAFENWVVADLSALKAQSARYKITPAMERSVTPDKADKVDALALLKNASVGRTYDKVPDSKKTLSKAKIDRIAVNSRSFRHFLHVVGDTKYQTQCRSAVAT